MKFLKICEIQFPNIVFKNWPLLLLLCVRVSSRIDNWFTTLLHTCIKNGAHSLVLLSSSLSDISSWSLSSNASSSASSSSRSFHWSVTISLASSTFNCNHSNSVKFHNRFAVFEVLKFCECQSLIFSISWMLAKLQLLLHKSVTIHKTCGI